MDTPNPAKQATERLQELILHAKDGSPIALAAVIRFIEQELPRISPKLVLFLADSILQSRLPKPVDRTPPRPPARDEIRSRPWQRSDQLDGKAASLEREPSSARAAAVHQPREARSVHSGSVRSGT